MTTVDLNKPKKKPDREQIRPAWMTTWASAWATIDMLDRRGWHWVKMRAFYLLPDLARWLFLYFPRGFWRITTKFAAWINDKDSWELRHEAATAKDTAEWQKAHNPRKSLLHARWIVCLVLALPVLIPVMAWNYPRTLACILGALLGCLLIKVIPGRGMDEVIAGVVVWILVWVFLPDQLAKIPQPPVTAWYVIGAGLFIAISIVGRPSDKPMATPVGNQAGVVPRLTAPILVRALTSLGNSKMTPKTEEDPATRIEFLTDPHRNGAGYQVEVQLPHGVVAGDVMDKREELSSGLRRELGCVWPSQGPRHAAHLSLFVADQAMSESAQAPWPLMKAKPVNLFEPVPMFTNNINQWVSTTFAYTSWVIGAVPRMGKTYLIRQFGLVAGLDPRTKVYAFDLKGTGDLSPLAEFAHVYGVGDEPEDVEQQLFCMEKLQQEMRARARAIRELTTEQNPEKGKVTDALATASPSKYGLIVVVVDECQVWFEEFDEKLPSRNMEGRAVREKFIALVRDLVKRGPALGIVMVLATQKPSAKSIPSEIADMAVGRACFKVSGDKANNQILGPGMYAAGIRATQFGFGDKGVCYVKTEGADAQIGRTVHGLHAKQAEHLAVKIRAMRQAAGLLTGQAIGEVEEEQDNAPDFATDVFTVMSQASRKTMSYAELADALVAGRPTHYTGWDADTVAERLRAEGIRTDPVHIPGGKKERGTHVDWVRSALDGAA